MNSTKGSNPDSYTTHKLPRILIDQKKKYSVLKATPQKMPANGQYHQKLATFFFRKSPKTSKIQNLKHSPGVCSRQHS